MDSKELLNKQIQTHAATLCDLLASPGAEVPPAELMEFSLRGTRMLAGSSGVMGLSHWAELCSAFETLLRRYEENQIPWDDRIADVTSELIEKEETMVAAFEADPTVNLDSIIPGEEMVALIAELVVLDEEWQSTETEFQAKQGEEIDTSAEAAEANENAADVPGPAAVPMAGVTEELCASFERARALLESQPWKTRDWSSPGAVELRRELHTIEFCARSIGRVISDNTGTATAARGCAMEPLRLALSDFAVERSLATGRRLIVELSDGVQAIEPGLLNAAAQILQPMIDDTLARCVGDFVRIQLNVTEARGAMRWSVTDDGNNFVSDSPNDHEDYLAFYPGLRDAINLLKRHHGVLWVEPGEKGERPRSRFEFTLPVLDAQEALVVWRGGRAPFAARATQVCASFEAGDDSVGGDEYGQYVTFDGMRAPLLRLDALYSQAPLATDAIVVVGSIEKRVAFFVPGPGEHLNADVFDSAVPVWQGTSPAAVLIDQQRMPVLDADGVLSAYHAITGALSTEQVSGGVSDDVPEVTPCQASSKEDDPSPPVFNASTHGENGVEVVVVEQSESAREALTAILSQKGVRAVCADNAESAIALVEAHRPRLIISEFRMPSMAAKQLIDVLASTGSEIPVLVTTSQAGTTADLLVEKLGAVGYISRPLDADRIDAMIRPHLDEVPH